MATILKTVCHADSKLLELVFAQHDDVESTTRGPQSYMYPFVWLRDNCQCSSCFQPSATARLLLFKDLDLLDSPLTVKLSDDRLHVTISWSSGHNSCYDNNWLLERRFSQDLVTHRKPVVELPEKLWGCELNDNVKQEKFNNLMTSDDALYQWIVAMEETGLFLVTDTPSSEESLSKLASRVSNLRKTCFGDTFRVETIADPTNIAFTSKYLSLHTDLPYYGYTPGVQMLHCIEQSSEGGENEFSDGFHVAEQLRKDDPETFRILSKTLVGFTNIATNVYAFHMKQTIPIICLDINGNVDRINFSNHARDSFLGLPPEDVHRFYVAMRKFHDLLYAKRNAISLKMTKGDIFCFHNYRVLHGRKSYTLRAGEHRLLVGGFLDWDDLRSRRRVLEKMLPEKLSR